MSGEEIVSEALSLGFDALEIGYGLSADAMSGIIDRVNEGAITLSSLHSFTSAFGGEGGHPEIFNPSASDEADRKKAVSHLIENLRYAENLGLSVVVLHAGRIHSASRHWPYLHNRIMNDSAGGFFYNRRLRRMTGARDAGIDRAMESLNRSLEEVLPEFEASGIKLAIENLPSFDAIPSFDEMAVLAKTFASSPSFAFWFDMGHAQVMENAGYAEAETLAKTHLNLIAGAHIHDVIGPGGDHQAPGFGGIDFKKFDFLRSKIKVFEPSSVVSPSDLSSSLEFIKDLWNFQ